MITLVQASTTPFQRSCEKYGKDEAMTVIKILLSFDILLLRTIHHRLKVVDAAITAAIVWTKLFV
jgi:hypothetical protein